MGLEADDGVAWWRFAAKGAVTEPDLVRFEMAARC